MRTVYCRITRRALASGGGLVRRGPSSRRHDQESVARRHRCVFAGAVCARSARLRVRGQRGEFRRRGIGAAGEQEIRRRPGGFPPGQPGRKRPADRRPTRATGNQHHPHGGRDWQRPVAISSLRLRGYPLLTKPLKIEELARALEAPPEASPPRRRNLDAAAPALASAEFAGLVGISERMKKIYRLISKVALQRHPVLIMGESGTGKELVARAIHTHGPWRDQALRPGGLRRAAAHPD